MNSNWMRFKMKQMTFRKTKQQWFSSILCMLVLSFVSSANAATRVDSSTRLTKAPQNTYGRNTTDAVRHLTSPDTIKCSVNPGEDQYPPGSPLSDNKSLGYVTQVALASTQQRRMPPPPPPPGEDVSFYNTLYSYCMTIGDLADGEREFKRRILDPMLLTSKNNNIDKYWTEAGCEPSNLANTMSPILHIIAENSTDRMQFVEFLQKYYIAKNDRATFVRILNARNTNGQTVLDYIQHSYSTRRFIKAEEAGLNKFVQFLCRNGATYAQYTNKSCPAEPLVL